MMEGANSTMIYCTTTIIIKRKKEIQAKKELGWWFKQ
jgi:hypothetical protein